MSYLAIVIVILALNKFYLVILVGFVPNRLRAFEHLMLLNPYLVGDVRVEFGLLKELLDYTFSDLKWPLGLLDIEMILEDN
jgi:uncharacterized membrane protein YwaF